MDGGNGGIEDEAQSEPKTPHDDSRPSADALRSERLGGSRGDVQGRIGDLDHPDDGRPEESSSAPSREGSGVTSDLTDAQTRVRPLAEMRTDATGAPSGLPRTDTNAGNAPKPRPRRDWPASGQLFQAHALSHFLSTSRIPSQLETLVANSLAGNRRLDHILIHGSPGSGTTLLAEALIRDYAPTRVVEIDAGLGCGAGLLTRSIDQVGSRGVLLIRHVEALGQDCESILSDALGSGHPGRALERRRDAAQTDESDVDRAIAESAAQGFLASKAPLPRDFTVVATAHHMPAMGYMLRKRFEHVFHLREDPKALCDAVVRAIMRHLSIPMERSALPQLELVLKTLGDSAEPIARAIALRAQMDDLAVIDASAMRSILEVDLASRIPDEAYAWALRRHLGARRIESLTQEEVERVAAETGWGVVAADAAISTLIREDGRKRVA